MKRLIILILLIIPISGFCQSFVFCPEIKTEAKQGFNDLNVSIVFKDSRVYEKRIKLQCPKEEIFAVFVNSIMRTFPNLKITVLDESKFDENTEEGNVTFKINLKKYEATFYPGVYIANTNYEVILFDNRNGINIIKDTITGEGKQFNALGYKSGKIASNSSFKRAFDQFILMFDNLAPKRNEGFTNDEALAELKRFKEKLDLQLITQDEYDKKKAELMKYIR